jgi:hypothetical protein
MPSPQPDLTQKVSLRQSPPTFRRAASLPPETSRFQHSPPPISVFKQGRLQGPDENEVKEGQVAVEELSPNAIIPDSVTVMRDPVVELPDDGESFEGDLEKKFTAIKLDVMRDSGESDTSEEQDTSIKPATNARKRKHTPTEEGETETQRRKRMASPMTFSPRRRNN